MRLKEWWSMILTAMAETQQEGRSKRQSEPRNLTDKDYDAWEAAFSQRPPEVRTVEQARKAIQHMNPVKWRQLQGDYKWLQRKMKKLGLNPEDARFLL